MHKNCPVNGGIGNNFHSVASLSCALGFVILDRKFRIAKSIFLFLIIMTTSLKIFVSIIAVYFIKMSLVIKLIIIMSIMILFRIYVYDTFLQYEDVAGKIWHLNGRTNIWFYLLEKFTDFNFENKLFGNGYHIGHQFESYNQYFYNAHNIFVSVLLNNGYVGVVLIGIVFAIRFYHILFGNLNVYQTSVFVLFTINSLANSSFFAAPSLVGFLGLCIIVVTRRSSFVISQK